MADSIESFVEKLHKEGVEAGQAQAEKIAAEAREQADQILADAKKQAEHVLAEARNQAEQTLAHGRSELELAARDVFGKLRQTVTDAVSEVLRRSTAEALRDEKFLAGVIRDVVVEYARKDADRVWPIEIRLDGEKADAVMESVMAALGGQAGQAEGRVDWKGKLESAGFEYKVSGAVVEVTAESIAAVLGEMIAPRLRELIDKAVAEQAK